MMVSEALNTGLGKRSDTFHDSFLLSTLVISGSDDLTSADRDGIVACAQSAFGSSMKSEEVLEHLRGTLHLVRNKTTQEIVAFGASDVQSVQSVFPNQEAGEFAENLRQPGLYLGGAAVRQDAQKTDVYSEMNMARLEPMLQQKLPYVFTRTQNPRVEKGILAALEKFQQQGLLKGFTLERVVAPKAYGRMLTAERPTIGDPKVASAYASLAYEEGDAFILIFFTYPSAGKNGI